MVDALEDLKKLPKTYVEAHSSGSRYYFTGKPCKRGHIYKRYSFNGDCNFCRRIRTKNKREDPEFRKKEMDRRRSPECWEREKAWQRQYRKTPFGRAYKNAFNAQRRHLKANQTPSWADLDAIREFYKNCPEGYQVDHIIPLKNGVFPSFHSLENLQYLPARENISKGKKVDPLSLEHYPCCVLPGYRSYVSPQSAGASLGVLKFNLEDVKMEETP